MESDSTLSVRSICKKYGGVVALSDVSFELQRAAITAIIGANGAGKTTLFDVITGFTKPDSGHVFVRHADATGASPECIARLGVRRTFQGVRLARRLSVLDNILLAAGGTSINRFERCGLKTPNCAVRRASEILAIVGLRIALDEVAGKLSFGEQKLLSLALCELGEPTTLLLDEPFAGVDAAVVSAICVLLRRWTELGKSILVIEHNIGAVVSISDRVIVLERGRILKNVKPADVGKDDQILRGFLRG